ncbi:MAG TPA: PepSY-associated TM helix domain-containing protein, partial [Chthoniobacterales bacterium]
MSSSNLTSKPLLFSANAVRRWCWWHKWTSLVCTLFILMLCVTGLPLIFHEEIDRHFSGLRQPDNLPANTPRLSFDQAIAAAKTSRPGEVVHIVTADPAEPNRLYVGMGKTPGSPLDKDTGVFVDTRNGKILGEQRYGEGTFIQWALKLHTEMFAGTFGKLFLGTMGLLFVVAIVSGVVIYAPFMRERSFGVVRRTHSSRLRWLDLHNLLGITIAVWVLVVGITGIINTSGDFLKLLWQVKELGTMIAPYR